MVLIYFFGLLFLKNVFFPLVSFPRKKNNQIVFNQSPLIDLFNIANTSLLFILIIRSYADSAWYEWLYFIFPLAYFSLEILLILGRWNSEIRIDNDCIIIQEKKYDRLFGEKKLLDPVKVSLSGNNFKFYKGWNNEDNVSIQKYKRLIRAFYLNVNDKQYNLNELRLNIFFFPILKELQKRTEPGQVQIELSSFEKYHGIRWVYTILFLASLSLLL